ncbi:hypothetical protein ACH4UY_13565 [Streptomyces longwoodensis]|uniref:hypothetical protein n=1 Tax=Streptomyces longwoodensis TaxID=68231 RepID=UPI0037B51127
MLSKLCVVPVGDEEPRAAPELLMDGGLHGYEYAIDAGVAEAALRQHRPEVVLTTDIDDIVKQTLLGVLSWAPPQVRDGSQAFRFIVEGGAP